MSITSIPTPTPSSHDLAHFATIPWCATLLSSPSFHAIPAPSRSPLRQPTTHTFVSETLNTAQTIKGWASQARIPQAASAAVAEVRCFLDLGAGLSGHAGVAHGGFVAVVLDEVTGLLLVANEVRDARLLEAEAEGGIGGRERFRGPVMTVGLNVRYERPVPVPGVVLARAVLEGVQGRKRFVTGYLEDGEGRVYARAEGVFVQLKEKL